MRPFLLVPLLLSAVLLLAAVDDESGLSMWLRLRDDLTHSQARIDQLRREIDVLRHEVEALRGDPFALERAIREDLEFARPGETVVRFAEPGADSATWLR